MRAFIAAILVACSSGTPAAIVDGGGDAVVDSLVEEVIDTGTVVDGKPEAPPAPACDGTTTFESLVADTRWCFYWAESFEDACGKRFQYMGGFGVEVYEFDKAGKLTRHYVYTDVDRRDVCSSPSVPSCSHSGGTCTSVCFTKPGFHTPTCPPDAGM